MTSAHMHARHYFGLLAVTVVWGLNFAMVKIGLSHWPPLLFVGIRFLAVAAVLSPFMRWLPRDKLLQVAALSLTLGVLHFGMIFAGMKRIDAATAAIAVQVQVPFAAILAAFVFKERLHWRRLLGIAIAFLGVLLIAGEPRFEGHLTALALILAAACVWATASIQIKLLGDDIEVFNLNGWVAALAAPQTLFVSWLIEDGQRQALASADWRAWSVIAYQAAFVTVMGYGVWYAMMRRFPVNQVMPFTLLVPLFGVLSGVLMLGERLTPLMLAGGTLTLAGVAVVVLRRPRVIAPGTKGGVSV
jgi:O-acetylserine/cysteine efflux transporter